MKAVTRPETFPREAVDALVDYIYSVQAALAVA